MEQQTALLTKQQIFDTISKITFRPGHALEVDRDERGIWFEVTHYRPDSVTDEMGWGRGGRRYVQEHWTASDLIRNIYGAFLAYEEHEVREFFRYEGEKIFSPHMDLVELAEQMMAGRIDDGMPT